MELWSLFFTGVAARGCSEGAVELLPLDGEGFVKQLRMFSPNSATAKPGYSVTCVDWRCLGILTIRPYRETHKDRAPQSMLAVLSIEE